jgi:tetratricopeptide (TPR) repeat protein
MQQDRLQEAEYHALMGLQLDSTYVPLHLLKGTIESRRKRHARAERHFRDAIMLEPDRPDLHEILSRSLYAQKKWAEAEAAARRAIELDPGDIQASLALAAALGAQADSEAIEVLEDAIAEHPDAMELYKALAELYIGSNMPDRGLAVLQDYLMRNPGSKYRNQVARMIEEIRR